MEDPRLQTPEKQARVATLFLPVVSFLRDFEPFFSDLTPGVTATPLRGARRESTRKVY